MYSYRDINMKTTISFITTFLIITLCLTLSAIRSEANERINSSNINSKYYLEYSDLGFKMYALDPKPVPDTDTPSPPIHIVPSQIKVVLLASGQQDLFLTVPDGKDNTTTY